MSQRGKRALLVSGILDISSSDISGISMAWEVSINPRNETSAHFQRINQHVPQFHHQRRGHSRLDTVFLLLLLTMRSSSYVEILIALDVTCSLVIDEQVSEGETWKSPACEGWAISNTDRLNMLSSSEGTSIKGFSYTKSAIIRYPVCLEVFFFTNLQINIRVRFCWFLLVSSECEVLLTAWYFVYHLLIWE